MSKAKAPAAPVAEQSATGQPPAPEKPAAPAAPVAGEDGLYPLTKPNGTVVRVNSNSLGHALALGWVPAE